MKYESGDRKIFSSISSAGFSLPEMLVALTVFAILVSVSGPVLKSILADRRVASIAQDLYGSLLLARTEAVKRRSTVSMCSSLNGTSCEGDDSGWQNGWIMFSDENGNGEINESDQILKIYEARSNLITIDWNRGDSLGFNSLGQTSQAGTFQVCENAVTGMVSRAIVISMTGRARIEVRNSCG